MERAADPIRQKQQDTMKRYMLIGLASGIVLVGLLIYALVPRPLSLETQPQGGPEPTCKESADFCAERCEVRNQGAECIACCTEAKAACDKSGSYREPLVKCMRAISNSPK